MPFILPAEMLACRHDSLEGKVCLISGSGNVAQYTAEKLIFFWCQGDHPFRFLRLYP